MTRALLLLTGGRGVPDMLMIKNLHPDKIFNITTEQGMKSAIDFQQFSLAHFHRDIKILPTINPFDEREIKAACKAVIDQDSGAEWIIHFTGSPKIVGIYAHDVAREYNIPFCFLDTEGKQLISLVKDLPIDARQFFKASVEEYMGAYGRTNEIPKSATYRSQAQSWYTIAQILVQMPGETSALLKGLRRSNALDLEVDNLAQSLLDELARFGMLTITGQATTVVYCRLSSNDVREFLKGDWLEVYVWQEAMNAGFADDGQWGYKIVVDQKLAAILPSNELDLALTYNARLLIAECKTSNDPFDSVFLDKLYSIANLVGGGYVRQAFITNTLSTQGKKSFDNFQRQADVRRICVIPGERLKDVGKILRQQIGAAGPTLPPSFRSF